MLHRSCRRIVIAPSHSCAIPAVMLAALAASPEGRDVPFMSRVLEGAHRQVGLTLRYDQSYLRLRYPGGDVPIERGACADVIVRAYRHAGIDLQVLVHEDMSRDFDAYPRRWGMARPDPSIDHRRVLNLATFFRRHGEVLPGSTRPEDYRAGDIVTWRLPSGNPHIGLVADRRQDGRPLIIHNLRTGVRVDDILFSYPITGHYRYDPPEATGQ